MSKCKTWVNQCLYRYLAIRKHHTAGELGQGGEKGKDGITPGFNSQLNLADKLPQSQLEDVNPNLTPFPVLDQHGGVVPLFLQKKMDCIKFKFSKPQNICCKSP